MNVDPIETNIRKLRNIGKTKNSFLSAGDLYWISFTNYHLVSHLLWPLPEITKMVFITHSQHRDLEQKLNTTKFGSIFNLNMMLTILDAWMFEIFDNFWHHTWMFIQFPLRVTCVEFLHFLIFTICRWEVKISFANGMYMTGNILLQFQEYHVLFRRNFAKAKHNRSYQYSKDKRW